MLLTEVKPSAAEEIGRATYPWWPDLSVKPVVIVASGPSARMYKLDVLRAGFTAMAVKLSFDLIPWASIVYGCEPAWWIHRRGLPEFSGLKLMYDMHLLPQYPDMKGVRVDTDANKLLLDKPAAVGSGGNSGFQALNLAVQFGARRIALVGFDMSDRGGVHWYGRNNWAQAHNPDRSVFGRWIKAFDTAATQLSEMGIEVVLASPHSALKCFPQLLVPDLVEKWR